MSGRSRYNPRTWWKRYEKKSLSRKSPRKQARFSIERLEDRRVLAWNLNLSIDATTNVSSSTVGNVTTFTATGTGANLHWSDVLSALAGGNNVVINSGSTGAEAGNITDSVGAQLVPFAHDGLTLTFQSGSGSNLVGNIAISFIGFTGNDASVVIAAHGSVTTGAICKGPFAGPREQLSSVSITAANGTVTTGGVFGGRVEAVNLSVQAAEGIGTQNSSFLTKASRFEAQTNVGGIFVDNVGSLVVGGASSSLSGVRVIESGNIVLKNDSRIDVAVGGDRVIGPGNIHLQATGSTSDILVGDNAQHPFASIESSGGSVTLTAGQDVLLGNPVTGVLGNVYGGGDVNLFAGRHVVVDCGTFVFARNQGKIFAKAGGNISVIDTAGAFAGAELRTAGGDITLIAGVGGSIVANNISSPAIQTRESGGNGNITLVADRFDIRNTISAGTGTVTLRTASANGSVGIHIGGADDSGVAGITDAELNQIVARNIVIGDKSIANTITVSGLLKHVGDANVEVLTARNIAFEIGANWTTINGNLSFRANQEAAATTGDFSGIQFERAFLTSSGFGNILLQGRGGNTGSDQHGIELVESVVQVNQGNIQIEGRGGAGSAQNRGIQLRDNLIRSTSTATASKLSLHGTGGSGSFLDEGVSIVDSQIQSAGAAIEITGIGTASNFANGIRVGTGSLIAATGNATITLDGTAGGSKGRGVYLDDGDSLVSSEAGAIVIIGRRSGDGFDPETPAIVIGNSESTGTANVSSAGGDITLIGNTIHIDPQGSIDAGTNRVVIKPESSDSVSIQLGGADAENVLSLTDAELDRITAGTIVLGDSSTGPITLSEAITRTGSTDIELHSAAAIVFDGGSLNTAGGNVLLAPGTGGVDPGTAGVDITAGTVSFNSDLAIAINGQTVDTEHRQLNVAGTVDLAGVDLVLSGAFVPPTGTFYVIVAASNILNQFNGLNHGDIINVNGVDLRIHYTSTAVVLERAAVAQAGTLNTNDAFGVAGIKIPLKIQAHANDTDGNEVFRVLISGVPEGATFWRGNIPTGKDLGGGVWRFTQEWLNGLSILLPAGHVGTVELSVTARSVETTSGDVSEVTEPLSIFVSDVKNLIALGTEAGRQPWVQVIDITTGNVVAKFLAYDTSFTGGVRVALGDMTGDGLPEIVTAQGQGDRNVVRVFNLEGVELKAFRTAAYDATNFSGVNVAVGDVDGDGRNDIVVAPSQGKTEIRVFRNEFIAGNDPLNPVNDPIASPWRRFTAFAENFTGGAVVAVADLGTVGRLTIDPDRMDGQKEIIVGSGAGMRATVRIFGVQSTKPVLVQSFYAFSESFLGGISSLDVGRIGNDIIPDIVVGAGQGYGSMVRVFNGRTGALINSFRAFEGESRQAAVHLALLDANADGVIDQIVTAQGTGGTTRAVRSFDPLNGTLVDELMEGDPDFSGEYWIGA